MRRSRRIDWKRRWRSIQRRSRYVSTVCIGSISWLNTHFGYAADRRERGGRKGWADSCHFALESRHNTRQGTPTFSPFAILLLYTHRYIYSSQDTKKLSSTPKPRSRWRLHHTKPSELVHALTCISRSTTPPLQTSKRPYNRQNLTT